MLKYFLLITIWFAHFLGEAQKVKLGLPVGHTNVINTADISKDGRYAVTASFDETIKLWEIRDGKLLKMKLRCGEELKEYEVKAADSNTLIQEIIKLL